MGGRRSAQVPAPKDIAPPSRARDSTASVVDAGSSAQLQHLKDLHTNGMTGSVAWSPDGSMLAMGSGDKTVSVVDAGSWACVQHLKGHLDP